ncbi:MAG: Sugar transferase [Candidatus Gottesmanbacteria bacterium GW2011_GWC2_39_8]|uniref:Sugar transferase n=1 Tax=Candidatus Gottesmanbacteria bacterium GW2011_GWC2_39_8 TaxID=1618450 RepID=A0A0G0S8H1_9BACT|nr:MAG: Sugar transferase [Candidatus Gottesmanbacteria bacterium GW2011_GWC2_39_8]
MIKLKDGGPIFYQGVRLGRNKKPFTMYKFRTLIPDAQKIIGAELLSSKHNVVAPWGKFLRDSRLDELPQLFNILKSDMDFVGPRPERPEIYEKICKHIKGYDKRFDTKPGLIGFSQLFTPHSSPKRIRTLIDNRLLVKKQDLLWDTSIIIYTILVVVVTTCYKIFKICNKVLKNKILGMYSEKRVLERVQPIGAKIYIGSENDEKGSFAYESRLVDINEDAFLMYTNHKIDQKDSFFKLKITWNIRGKKGVSEKSAICTGKVYKESEIKNKQFKYSYVIKYTPISPLNFYMVHQYFLSESMV